MEIAVINMPEPNCLNVLSPAKINLALAVLDIRSDGYHNLDSVVQKVDLFDTLHLRVSKGNSIKVDCDRADVPSGSGNLVYKACRLFQDRFGIEAAVEVRIDKRIPPQAGLGGGSSNAASALLVLDRLFRPEKSKDGLLAIGAEVGSDVPLFMYDCTVRMRGRGELVRPLQDLCVIYYVIVKPACGVSTAAAYRELDNRASSEIATSVHALQQALAAGDSDRCAEYMHNDFQEVIFRCYPEVNEAASDLLGAGADRVLLAGSGSAVAAVFASKDAAVSVHEKISQVYNDTWVASSLPAGFDPVIKDCK